MESAIKQGFDEGYELGVNFGGGGDSTYQGNDYGREIRTVFRRGKTGKFGVTPIRAAERIGQDLGGAEYCLKNGNPMGAAGNLLDIELTYAEAIKVNDPKIADLIRCAIQKNSPVVLEGLKKENRPSARKLERKLNGLLTRLNINSLST